MEIRDCIGCPKCHKRFLKDTTTPYTTNSNLDVGRKWYCHNCHTYFGTWELVNIWDLDAGDLLGDATSLYTTHGQFSGYPEGEPYWSTGYERKDAYQVVSRMFLGVEEVDDYADLLATQDCAMDIGVQ